MRLMIADDDNLVRDALTIFLQSKEKNISVVGAAALDEALDCATRTPDLDAVLLDLSMPGMNGLAGMYRMIDAAPGAKVAILSGRITWDEAQRAIRNGAAGVISKRLHGEALIDALRLILKGEKFVSSSLPEERERAMAPLRNPPEIGDKRREFAGLSDKERATLAALVTGLSNKEIGRKLGIAEVTVKVRLQSIFRKIGARNRTEAARIVLAAQQGSASPVLRHAEEEEARIEVKRL